MANPAHQSTSGTNQDHSARHEPSQPNQAGQPAHGSKPQGQQQESGRQTAQPATRGHPPGATQGDNPRQPSSGSKP